MERSAIFTNDVETHSVWLNELRDETGFKVLKEAMPKLLEIYSKYNVKSTFFYTGYIAKKFPDVVKLAFDNGHEIGCHGLSHKLEHGFDVMPFKKQKKHLVEAKKILEDITGNEVISFRAPALRVNGDTTRALIETGFLIDSSISSQRFDFFFSFGSREKFKFLTSPRLPYKTSVKELNKIGDGPLVEVPVSAIILPYIGPSLRAFSFPTKILRNLLIWENKLNGKPIVFYSHPPEFLDERDEFLERKEISRRVNSYFEFLIRDWLKTKIKHKNLGTNAFHLLERELASLEYHDFSFLTLKEYCKKKKLI